MKNNNKHKMNNLYQSTFYLWIGLKKLLICHTKLNRSAYSTLAIDLVCPINLYTKGEGCISTHTLYLSVVFNLTFCNHHLRMN